MAKLKPGTNDPVPSVADLPSPIPDDGGDTVLLSLFDDALDAAFGKETPRNREIVRSRMSLHEGGPWMTLQSVGNDFGVSRERIRQILAKFRRRLIGSKDPRVDLLRQYIRRSSLELGEGAFDDGVVQLALLAFPNSHRDTAIDLLVTLGFEGTPTDRKRSSDSIIAARKRLLAEGRVQARDENLRSKASAIMESWISSATWPQNAVTEGGSWVPARPGRETGGAESACDFESKLLQRAVGCDSRLESRFYARLEASQLADWYVEQPFSIPYLDEFERERKYWPDALVQLTDGRWLLVEVKPTFGFIHETNQRKWAAAAERCATLGVGFLVVDPGSWYTLGRLLSDTVPASLADPLDNLAENKQTIGWHEGRSAARQSSPNFEQFAAWVLQRGKASCPSRGWCLAPIEQQVQARTWSHISENGPELGTRRAHRSSLTPFTSTSDDGQRRH